MQPKIAIVILNYNGRDYLRKFLPSLLRYSTGHRIIVADNASTDDSIEVLSQEFPEVELLILEQNFGFAGGYNKALQQIKANYYLLLNSDVEVTEGWLEPMAKLLDSNPQIAACQPKILSYHKPAYFEYAGAAGGFLDSLAYPFCRGRIFDTLEKNEGQYNSNIPVFWASGACFLIRAEIFHQMGGFDERFFAHMEEIDLCWRLHTAGYQVYACGQSSVYHVGGGTLPKNNPRKTFLNFRNGLWMLMKNSSYSALGWKLPARIILDWLAALHFLQKGQTKDGAAVLKAHVQLFSLFFSPKQKRITEKKVKGEKAPLFKGSILWLYYIRRVRKFRQLGEKRKNIGKIQNASV
ncbi:glycosyltransferase family 2 protein [Nafulsella turpanensis]|uniref:glycosyltransferase family 2 protein n=1 Tax=Nafulsella turpanensis TaxID=1265690 RepID=UPI0003483C93|nr:glycosyltransferase family 2 protein [Nafulsella turpanensis]